MCGIAGAVSIHRDHAAFGKVEAMTAALIHRGPDSQGHFAVPHLTLGVRRLAIIDVAHGDQPIFSENRRIVTIANCEIYNHIELRANLEKRGHSFSTRSDAEVIVHLYEDHGESFVDFLRGMFAIALWDDQRQRLLLARDRMGEKPLYVHESDGTLLFASEMKALLRSGARFELDPDAVNEFLHFGYVPEPRTAVRGIRKLPAATLMTFDVAGGAIRERCYWDMEESPAIEGDAPSIIRERLEDIAAIVVRSDVPVGIALSGGLDSTTIAALLAKKQLHCISVGYPGNPELDESRLAEETSRKLRLPFSRIEVAGEDVADSFPDLVRRQDDPIADIAAAAYSTVARAAREAGIKVLLQGQGSDELFWGYPWVAEAVRQTRRKQAGKGAYIRPHLPDWRGRRLWVRSGFGLKRGWDERRRDRTSPREQLVFYDLTPLYEAATHLTGAEATRPFTRNLHSAPRIVITKLICETYLRCNGIAQADRLSMSHSVEPRNPFVDHRLVEAVIGLRKLQDDVYLSPKAWLRSAVADLLPPAMLNRPKRGFRPPAEEWRNRIFDRHGRRLRDGYLAGHRLFDPAVLASFAAPARREMLVAFPLLVLELWCRELSVM